MNNAAEAFYSVCISGNLLLKQTCYSIWIPQTSCPFMEILHHYEVHCFDCASLGLEGLFWHWQQQCDMLHCSLAQSSENISDKYVDGGQYQWRWDWKLNRALRWGYLYVLLAWHDLHSRATFQENCAEIWQIFDSCSCGMQLKGHRWSPFCRRAERCLWCVFMWIILIFEIKADAV